MASPSKRLLLFFFFTFSSKQTYSIILPLKALNPLQLVKGYNSLEGKFSGGNVLTSPTAEWVSAQPVSVLLWSTGMRLTQ